MKIGIKLSKWRENTVGKVFTVFLKDLYCKRKKQGLSGKRVKNHQQLRTGYDSNIMQNTRILSAWSGG